jgi:hypothetical protein
VQVPYDEGVANHIDPESCAGFREGVCEALTGERAGQAISCSAFAPATLMETDATSREDAPAFSGSWRRTSMLASSIPQRRFRGSCRARSGGIAPRTASTFATAIASTTTAVATTGIAHCFAAVIASLCAGNERKSRKINDLKLY